MYEKKRELTGLNQKNRCELPITFEGGNRGSSIEKLDQKHLRTKEIGGVSSLDITLDRDKKGLCFCGGDQRNSESCDRGKKSKRDKERLLQIVDIAKSGSRSKSISQQNSLRQRKEEI